MEVTIKNLDHYGRGIAKVNNKICFIENSLPNEVVDIKITKEKKNYLEGEVIKYIKKSPKRNKELCPYSNICGGCTLRHISFEEENIFKANKVKELVEKFTKLDKNIVKEIVYDNESNYRNKITFHIKNNKLGLYKKKSNNLVEIDKCLLIDNKINDLIKDLKILVRENSIKEITIKIGNITNEIMVSIIGEVNNYNNLLNKVKVLVINDEIIFKDKYITSLIGNKKYIISNKSFFQVNETLTKKLYDEVLINIKKLNSKNVLDLYCGTGTIGIYISEVVNKVLGIELVKDAVMDANCNKELNNTKNISFKAGKTEDLIESITDKYDTIIIDPPRKGLDKLTIENILRINPENIIYVSCDPTTLCRDLNLLNENYNVEYIKPFNMFPKTTHVECVSVLHRR